MANNQYVNKVVFGNETLIDLTQDTINPGVLMAGQTAHNAQGAPITGTIQIRTPVSGFDTDGTYKIKLQYGLYSGTITLSSIPIPIPSSGANSIIIKVPNGVAEPDPTDDDDWIPITIEVDSSGNFNVVDDTIVATGVSF